MRETVRRSKCTHLAVIFSYMYCVGYIRMHEYTNTMVSSHILFFPRTHTLALFSSLSLSLSLVHLLPSFFSFFLYITLKYNTNFEAYIYVC